jgi:hypothetical protein
MPEPSPIQKLGVSVRDLTEKILTIFCLTLTQTLSRTAGEGLQTTRACVGIANSGHSRGPRASRQS